MAQLDDLHHVKRGVAVLAAVVVQTLNATDQSYQKRFLENLVRAHGELEGNTDGSLHEIELLHWTRELLTGWSFSQGQGKPFLDN